MVTNSVKTHGPMTVYKLCTVGWPRNVGNKDKMFSPLTRNHVNLLNEFQCATILTLPLVHTYWDFCRLSDLTERNSSVYFMCVNALSTLLV